MKKEVKTSVEGLQIGMFVSRLDRPWIQTPFDLECVQLKSPDDIERLKACCNYVFVDVEQGSMPDPRYWILSNELAPQEFVKVSRTHARKKYKREGEIEYTRLRKTTYQDRTNFDTESTVAKDVTGKLAQDYEQVLSDLKRGRKLDLSVVKEGVSTMVESVIRNPSAMVWMAQVKKLDENSYSRALGTSVWCATFGRHLGMDAAEVKDLALGGLLLDVGKVRIPVSLLTKKGPLDEREMRVMRAHVELGVKLLVAVSDEQPSQKLSHSIMQMIATHHERADGQGYPQGLPNDHIPMFGRIAGIVDTYDAMTSRCPYNPNADIGTPHEAIHELYGLRDKDFQSELVEQFIQTVGLYPTGSLVELTSGEVGVVVATNGLRRLRPSVMLLLNSDKEPLPVFHHLDLSQMENGPTVMRGLPIGAYGIDMKELFL
jgi:HD-GYP domain-containing protein (c-di-GMP phosphodiesterase class II)